MPAVLYQMKKRNHRVAANIAHRLILIGADAFRALINQLGQGRLKAFSAGNHPVGKINTGALAIITCSLIRA